ncbi:glycosyltransferase [Agrococcus sp. TSP3-2-1]|uniref:glycosyltransferase n=1 Tax=Agrococcus sp. TSP3-2-1 TaxID=2804583 RepID=UPI003CF2D102
MMTTVPAVAHLDHSVEPGGGELALRRLLETGPAWDAMTFVPPSSTGAGTYASLGDAVRVVGVRQPAGVIGASAGARALMLARVALQAAALRVAPEFRRCDVVHTNTSRAALIGLLATVGSRKRLVVHLRDAVDEAALGGLPARALRAALSRAHGVIANSDYTLESARRWIRPDAAVAVIPSPIGIDRRRPVAPLRPTVRTIGMLARLAPWKGQAELVRAFAAACPAGTGSSSGGTVRLQLAGAAAFAEAGFERELRALIDELGIADRVDLLGHVDDVWPLLDDWDVCVHASTRAEPLGQNVLQYLAAARPLVATAAGGPLELVDDGETGLLVEPGDVGALAAALRRLVDEPGLREQLHRTVAAWRPVPPDSAVARAHAELFARVAAPSPAQADVRAARMAAS